jgi:hypothetical protein
VEVLWLVCRGLEPSLPLLLGLTLLRWLLVWLWWLVLAWRLLVLSLVFFCMVSSIAPLP